MSECERHGRVLRVVFRKRRPHVYIGRDLGYGVRLRVGDGDREQSLAAVLLPVRRGSPIVMGRASLHPQHAHSRPGCVELRYPPTVRAAALSAHCDIRSTPRHELRGGVERGPVVHCLELRSHRPRRTGLLASAQRTGLLRRCRTVVCRRALGCEWVVKHTDGRLASGSKPPCTLQRATSSS